VIIFLFLEGLVNGFNSNLITVNEQYKPKAIIKDSLLLNKDAKKKNVKAEIINCGMIFSKI
jgi:hypothetical protein